MFERIVNTMKLGGILVKVSEKAYATDVYVGIHVVNTAMQEVIAGMFDREMAKIGMDYDARYFETPGRILNMVIRSDDPYTVVSVLDNVMDKCGCAQEDDDAIMVVNMGRGWQLMADPMYLGDELEITAVDRDLYLTYGSGTFGLRTLAIKSSPLLPKEKVITKTVKRKRTGSRVA